MNITASMLYCSYTILMNLDFNKNEDAMRQALSQLRSRFQKIALGGGIKAIDKQHEKNKLTARERIDYLLDENTAFIEIGAFAGYEMYEEQGGCPAGGTVAGIGYVSGRQCVILANDQTVKAGAWFPITGKKNLRMQEIAMENHLPVIYIVDSAGVFLPMQDEIFPDKEHFGRIFRNNARMSAMGITQIAAVMGPCVAGGAYLPIMSDETLMVEGNGSIFLAGPYLVKAAIGEDEDTETLGGAITHTEISGIADYKFNTEQECLDQVKKIMSHLGITQPAGSSTGSNRCAPAKIRRTFMASFRPMPPSPYDMLDIIERIVDDPGIRAIQRRLRQNHPLRLCPHRRLGGWHCRQPAQDGKNQKRRNADGRRDLQRQRRQGRPLYHELQSKKNPAGLSAGCDRLYGRHPQRTLRHHQGRRQNGECRRQFGRAEIHHHHRQFLRGRQLCHVRQSL